MSFLAALLEARRIDLLDGFPVRAALTAFRASDPLAKLNELLAPHLISVALIEEPCPRTVPNRHLLKHGIVAATLLDGLIVVSLLPSFFVEAVDASFVIRALMLQSVCLHQLVHRKRGHKSCCAFYKPLIETLQDESELEAVAAGLEHDMRIKDVVSLTGVEQLQELSPRLANILDHSKELDSELIARLSQHMRSLSSSK